jgi:predicted PurR-regulated permease PerM
VIPILAIFFLSDGSNLANSLIRLVSTNDNLETVQSLADDLNVMLRHYIRAKVTLVGLAFIFYSVAMLVLGFPHPIALALTNFTVMVGGVVCGIVGIYLSVPLVAALRVVWHRFAHFQGRQVEYVEPAS